jgi:hypothetical protein
VFPPVLSTVEIFRSMLIWLFCCRCSMKVKSFLYRHEVLSVAFNDECVSDAFRVFVGVFYLAAQLPVKPRSEQTFFHGIACHDAGSYAC